MRHLIDTHVLLWWWADDPKLSGAVRRLVAHGQIWVSAAVVWEMMIKKRLGKLSIPDGIEEQLEAEGFRVLDIKLRHVLELERLADHHADPFDRIQIAQAKAEEMVLVTADQNILQYEEIEVFEA